jgi:archaemetzincin
MTRAINERFPHLSWRFWLTIVGSFALFGAGYAYLVGVRYRAEAAVEDPLPQEFARLLPLHARLREPESGDWLDAHFELGQSYQQYLRCRPVRADERRTIYVQPFGEMNASQRKIVDLAAEFLGVYYQLPVRTCDGLSLDGVPAEARRARGEPSEEQMLTTYVLDEILKPRAPEDAVALIAFTTKDLWAGEGWNRVYGEARLHDRVGVWSIYCFGDPAADAEAFRLCLLRTLKTSCHEMGHVFTMSHCTFRECNMCGSNHLGELDRHPLELCPRCLAKLCHATGADPVNRWQQLIAFFDAHGLTAEREFCEESLRTWKKGI